MSWCCIRVRGLRRPVKESAVTGNSAWHLLQKRVLCFFWIRRSLPALLIHKKVGMAHHLPRGDGAELRVSWPQQQ
jgi:hypothetical protein